MDLRKRMKSSGTRLLTLRSVFLSSFLLLLLLSYRFLLFSPPTHLAFPDLRIQARVFLPDFLLFLLQKDNFPNLDPLHLPKIDCVYHHASSNSHPVTSIDVYDEFRWMVRCPLPPHNHSLVAGLRWHHGGFMAHRPSAVVPAWDNVAYEARLLGNHALVFVKGLNLRRDREFDPNLLRCLFEFANLSVITTTAVGAAQEIVRCPLPTLLLDNASDPAVELLHKGVKVAVERTTTTSKLFPSVARLYYGGSLQAPDYWYQLCGCTMVWNQASALREWVMYHASMGVQRWFVYDNNSVDGLKSEVEALNSEGYNITRHPWPWVKTQEAGFSHCLLRAKKECSWVAFFDVDEFYYFPPSKGHRRDEIDSASPLGALVAEYSISSSSDVTIGEIRTKCHSFGPSGLTSQPPHGVTVGYTCRVKSTERHKSIVRPEAVTDSLANAVHHFKLREGFTSQNIPESRVLINHYKYQVWDAFKTKFSRRVSTYVADWQDNQNEGSRDRAPGLGKKAVQPLDWKQRFCEVWDTGLRDFVVANLADRDTGLLPWEISVSL